MSKYVCLICGYVYDEQKGIPEKGILPNTEWSNIPENFKCPLCGAGKSDFEIKEEIKKETTYSPTIQGDDKLRELSIGELSALCSNLSKGCEKQYLFEESKLFLSLADYFKNKTPNQQNIEFNTLIHKINNDLNSLYPNANTIVDEKSDRGAKRALVWSEKVTRMLNSLVSRYEKEGNAMLEHTKVFVCDICGFIYIGDEPPEVCPVCKVPKFKFNEIRR